MITHSAMLDVPRERVREAAGLFRGAGFGESRATAYRYRDEAATVLAHQTPDLHDVLTQVATQGWSHIVLEGKVFRTDRCAETTPSAKGETINAWNCGPQLLG